MLRIAVPLIISTSTTGLQTFIDRLLLAWYSSDALAATMTASLLSMAIISLLLGISSYVSVFVAQFFGANKLDMVIKVVWQGIYLALFSLLPAILLSFSMDSLFKWIGHSSQLQAYEIIYSEILIAAIPLIIAFTVLTGFFTGLGKTGLVMWVNTIVVLINLSLDYLLIFGNFGFPSLGVAGAAWATFSAYLVGTLLLFYLFTSHPYHNKSKTLNKWDKELFRRLLTFGAPVGLQAQLEGLAWALFILFVGALGTADLTAQSIVMNIFMLAMMPMTGISIAVSVIVGHYIGERNPSLASRATLSAMHIGGLVFTGVAIILIGYPYILIRLFSDGMTETMVIQTSHLLRDLFQMLAMYSVLQATTMVLAGALRGAGDTLYVAWVGIFATWSIVVLPTAVLAYFTIGTLKLYWVFVVLSSAFTCAFYTFRYRNGAWKLKSMLNESLNEENTSSQSTVN